MAETRFIVEEELETEQDDKPAIEQGIATAGFYFLLANILSWLLNKLWLSKERTPKEELTVIHGSVIPGVNSLEYISERTEAQEERCTNMLTDLSTQYNELVPPEIRGRSKLTLDIYKHEMKRKRRLTKLRLTVVNSRLTFLGKEGAGKTSCINSILKKKLNEDEPSTKGVMVTCILNGKEEKGVEKTYDIEHDRISKSILQESFEGLRTLIRTINDKPKPKPKPKPNRTIFLLDYPGQLKYFQTERFFLTKKSIYNVVFNLLDYVRTHSLTGSFQMPNRQMILFYVRTAYEYAILHSTEQPRLLNGEIYLPPILIVGTHKNKLSGSEAKKQIAEIKKEIINDIKDKPYSMHVYHEIFAVDNTNLQDEEIQKLRRKLDNYIDNETETVSIYWVEFQVNIQAVAETKLHLSLDEISKIADRCRIFDKSLFTVLEYLHESGIIFYAKSNKKLNNKVIIHLDKMIGMITKVTAPATKPAQMDSSLMDSWIKFDKEGILVEQLLHHLWKPEVREDVKNVDVVLEVMKMFGMIFEKGFQHGSRTFWVPSRITVKTKDLQMTKDQKHTVSIYVTPTDVLPDDIAHVLVVGFLKLMEIKGRNIQNMILYQNCNDFDLYNDHHVRLGTVCINNRYALKLEISCKSLDDEPHPSVCIEMLTYLKKQLKTVYGTIEDVGYELRVSCKACDFQGQPDLHKLNECVKTGWVKCGDKLIDVSPFIHLFATDLSMKEFDFRGGILTFNDVRLTITQNAIEEGKKVKIYLANIVNEEIPLLGSKETHLSPVVYCGPSGTVFKKPCLLSFPHSIVDRKKWKLTGLVKDLSDPGKSWSRVKAKEDGFRCHVKNGRCYIELRHFCCFSLVGKIISWWTNKQPVYLKVRDYWSSVRDNTYEVYVETYGRKCFKLMNYNDKSYVYAVTLNPMVISLEGIQNGWTLEPTKQTVSKALVWKKYSYTFYLKCETETSSPPCVKICLSQNNTKLEPHLEIPHNSNFRVKDVRSKEDTPKRRKRGPLHTICEEFSEHYPGVKYKWLRFLLYDKLHIDQLSDDGYNVMELLNGLIDSGEIKQTNVRILFDVAEVTKVEKARSCIETYKKDYECIDGEGLTHYRKKLFKAIRAVSKKELISLISKYKLMPLYEVDIKDIWDLVFTLEVEGELSDNQEHLTRFAGYLNGTAARIIKMINSD